MARIGTAIVVLFVVVSGVYFTHGRLGITREADRTSTAQRVGGSSENPGAGTLTEGDIGMPATLNPLLSQTQSERDLSRLIFSGLVRVDGSGTPTADLAEKWNISLDGLTYTMTLRRGVTWQDGRPFSSQDVRFTVGLIQSPGFPGDPGLAQLWRPIIVDTPDESTVVFHLTRPFGPFLNDLNFPILPKHILGGVIASDLAVDAFNRSPVGTGPFRFSSWDANQREIDLKAFEGFYGAKPSLSAISFRYYDDPEALLTDLRSGTVQATGSLSPDQILRAGVLPKGDTIYAPLLMSYTSLFLNTRSAPFSDQSVRQALQIAVNPSALINGPLQTQAIAGSSPIPASSWAFVPQSVSFDPQRASAMLQSAGWVYSEKDDVLEKGDAALSFQLLVNADDSQRMLMAQTIAQQLGEIHIRVDVQATSADNVSQALSTRQFTAAIFGGHYSNGDPDCFDVWGSTGSTAGLNVTGITDSVIDKTLQQARATTDVETRQNLYAQFQRDFVAQAPAIVLYYPRYLFVVSSAVQGVKADPLIDPSDRFQQVSSWYIQRPGVPAGTP